jgi:hypothetical protein
MDTKDSIPFIFYDNTESDDEDDELAHAFPGQVQLRGRIAKIKKTALAESLASLVSDIDEILTQLPTTNNKSELEMISVSVQIGATGGVALVASANTSVSSSMTLTFRLKADDKHK